MQLLYCIIVDVVMMDIKMKLSLTDKNVNN